MKKTKKRNQVSRLRNLLYSKTFRKNILKWLCMYTGALCILTIMVTYSRYITSFVDSNDHARSARFDIAIAKDDCPSTDSSCYYDKSDKEEGSIRPTDRISFYYTVDTTKLEVSTLLVVTLTIDKHNNRFSNPEIFEIRADGSEVEINPNDFDFNTSNEINITENIKASQGKIRKYKLVMDYDYENDYSSKLKYEDILKVSYSATQK